ncbi:hypothetical protein AABB24_033116 [Solanum stoloniferum]|uniref:Uncharacterized protein n=1 Tax=Solanum stoloniferum TaxID=62892 RepID=A0ABD2RLY8_9SOLN
MHRLPRIFAQKKRVDSKQKRAESSVKPKPKPKLQRLNARKNIDYEPSMLEFSGDKSFRIGGKNGEFIEFFEKLGFSGPDDFAIPTDEWDAMIVRSSLDNHVIDVNSNGSCCGGGGSQCSGSGRVIDLGSKLIKEDICLYSDSSKASDVIQLQVQSVELNYDRGGVVCAARVITDVSGAETRLDDGVTVNRVVSNGNEPVSLLGGGGGGGIRGLRPPLLAPPPVMSLPIVDDACSTWDIFRAFGPEDHRESGIAGHGICRSEVVNGDEEYMNDEENSNRRILGVSSLLSQSSSFTNTSNDDDSSSCTTERMSIISPNGRFTRFITGWDKGGLLGRGSFGSVYEGISQPGSRFLIASVYIEGKHICLFESGTTK